MNNNIKQLYQQADVFEEILSELIKYDFILSDSITRDLYYKLFMTEKH